VTVVEELKLEERIVLKGIEEVSSGGPTKE
jgi:hypothetical protein